MAVWIVILALWAVHHGAHGAPPAPLIPRATTGKAGGVPGLEMSINHNHYRFYSSIEKLASLK